MHLIKIFVFTSRTSAIVGAFLTLPNCAYCNELSLTILWDTFGYLSPQGTHTVCVCVCNRLLFYSKCTGFDYRWKLWLLLDLVPDVYKTWPGTWQSSLPRSRFLGGALRDIQKTAARETKRQRRLPNFCKVGVPSLQVKQTVTPSNQ